jgi:hypothetical protein
MIAVVVTTLGQSWTGHGKTMAKAVEDAFHQINKACHENNDTKLGMTYSVRLDTQPAREAIDGYDTIQMLQTIGEIGATGALILKNELKRGKQRKDKRG